MGSIGSQLRRERGEMRRCARTRLPEKDGRQDDETGLILER